MVKRADGEALRIVQTRGGLWAGASTRRCPGSASAPGVTCFVRSLLNATGDRLAALADSAPRAARAACQGDPWNADGPGWLGPDALIGRPT
jgi:hypothetical protein